MLRTEATEAIVKSIRHPATNRRECSPTAQLLRSSRLFSLPTPLPRPTVDWSPSGYSNASNTATLPYPTHQSIATPTSSLARGDWGLKRPLPLRSTTNTSTPSVRISAIDTIEQVTGYESSADHALSLKKWQEMDVPIFTHYNRNSMLKQTPKTAFDSSVDYTDPEATPAGERDERWKYSGPWLADMSEKEFQKYVSKEVCKRKVEFRRFIQKYIQDKLERGRRIKQMEEGIDEKTSSPTKNDKKKKLDLHMEVLREDTGLTGDLSTAIMKFLDLPNIRFYYSGYNLHSKSQNSSINFESDSMSSKARPTHFSAGLSYQRSNAVLTNHPILGPLHSRTPVEARVLQPRNSAHGPINNAFLGAGGFVFKDPQQPSSQLGRSNNASGDPGVHNLDLDTEGGRKVWVEPTGAMVDDQARISLVVDRANRDSIEIHRGAMPVRAPELSRRRHRRVSDETMPSLDSGAYGNMFRKTTERQPPSEIKQQTNEDAEKIAAILEENSRLDQSKA